MTRSVLATAFAFLAGFGAFSLPVLSADSSLPHKFEFAEGSRHYYLLAVVDAQDKTQLKGFQLFDGKDSPIQFIEYEEDLSDKVPDYILGNVPGATPITFEDCNFDGYTDIMIDEPMSKHHKAFDIWLWSPKRRAFIHDNALSTAGIDRVDAKNKLLYAGGSEGHGDFGTATYTYSRTGKLILLKTDIIEGSETSEVTTFYSEEGKATNTVNSVPPDQ